ncbi:multidrug effflux MFS transporter [Pseudomonas bohemica]|uniref:multidrug effflux MFS transporter n=1 Tax=Pseudomonas bohemica TaxID=2044872 RepID=UPI000DA5FC70|nr:multidrug effflux MFS transporter [Pseudomonas bohemica]
MDLLTSRYTIIFFAMIMALAPLASATYIPAFPAIGLALNASASDVQLTLSAYMLGMALAQPIYGPLADRWGRKSMIVLGTSVFAFASLGCLISPSIELLIVCRFLQAFGAAGGLVLSQAMVRDLFQPLQAARMLAYIGGVQAMAPAVGPLLGGAILLGLGWRAIFAVFLVLAAVVLFTVITQLPETLDPARRQRMSPATILRNYRSVLGNRLFLGHSLTLGFMTGGFYSFMSGAPFVLIELRGMPAGQFGGYYLLTILGFISGSFLTVRLSRSLSSHGVVILGGLLLAGGGALMMVLELAGVRTAWAVLGPQVVFTLGSGIMMAHLISGALLPFPGMAATAAAAMGFIQMSAGALTSALVSRAYDGTALPMTLLSAACGVFALLGYLLLVGQQAARTLRCTP